MQVQPNISIGPLRLGQSIAAAMAHVHGTQMVQVQPQLLLRGMLASYGDSRVDLCFRSSALSAARLLFPSSVGVVIGDLAVDCGAVPTESDISELLGSPQAIKTSSTTRVAYYPDGVCFHYRLNTSGSDSPRLESVSVSTSESSAAVGSSGKLKETERCAQLSEAEILLPPRSATAGSLSNASVRFPVLGRSLSLGETKLSDCVAQLGPPDSSTVTGEAALAVRWQHLRSDAVTSAGVHLKKGPATHDPKGGPAHPSLPKAGPMVSLSYPHLGAELTFRRLGPSLPSTATASSSGGARAPGPALVTPSGDGVLVQVSLSQAAPTSALARTQAAGVLRIARAGASATGEGAKSTDPTWPGVTIEPGSGTVVELPSASGAGTGGAKSKPTDKPGLEPELDLTLATLSAAFSGGAAEAEMATLRKSALQVVRPGDPLTSLRVLAWPNIALEVECDGEHAPAGLLRRVLIMSD